MDGACGHLCNNDQMSKNVTIKDVAAEAGVSISLVSFVMNNRIESDGKRKYRVNEATREKILNVARRLNYQPNFAARMLQSGCSKVIGVLLSDISNVFYGEIARRLEEIAFSRGYIVLFGGTDEQREKLDHLVRSFVDKGADGFVIVPCEGSESTLHRILDMNIPLVVMDRKDFDLPVPKVLLDNRAAMKKAVDLLVCKNIRKIEMLSYTMRVSSITEREAGFVESMKALGYGEKDIMIHRLPFEDIDKATAAVLPDVVERGAEGLVFATNSLTMAAIKKLFAMGVKVQRDISLVGFDNSDVYDCFLPQIPYVRQPIDAICDRAMSALIDLMECGGTPESCEIVLDGEVVIGGNEINDEDI